MPREGRDFVEQVHISEHPLVRHKVTLLADERTDAKTFRDTADSRPDGWQIVLQRGGRTFRSFVSG